MATTQVILTTNIRKLGGEGDIVKVRPGFARNFLIPTGRALPVTKFNMRGIETLKKKTRGTRSRGTQQGPGSGEENRQAVPVLHPETGR